MQIGVEDYARQCAKQGLRGDYSKCRADFTVAQGYDYSEADQEVWRTLCDRQARLTGRLAHRSYLDGVKTLGLLDRVPDFAEVSRKLRRLTGWELVAVPGLIPNAPFFEHLANRRFPVTNWLRSKEAARAASRRASRPRRLRDVPPPIRQRRPTPRGRPWDRKRSVRSTIARRRRRPFRAAVRRDRRDWRGERSCDSRSVRGRRALSAPDPSPPGAWRD